MIHNLKPYPAYKDSGVPWLGKVPEHWEVKRGKWLFRYKKNINADRSNSNILSLTLRGVVNNDPDNPEGLVPKDYASYQLFRKGDLVFKLIDLENLRTSRVGLVHEDGIMSPAYVRLVPQSINNIHYFFHQYFDLYQRGIYNQLGAGVRSTLSPNDLLNLSVLVPSLPEQSAIVRCLDRIDRRIRHYIRAKKKLIKLLEEQKQAIIHQAVTRGLDPNVKLKSSGVEWLGKIPEHWEVLPLKALSTVQSGITLGKQYLGQELVEFPYLRVANVQEGHVNLSEIKTIEVPAEEAKRSRLQKGDVLMTEGGDPDKLGRGCVWEGQIYPCLHQNHIFAVRPNISRLKPYYLGILLSSQYAKEYFLRTGKQTTNLASTNKTTIGQFPIPLPKVEEQDLILDTVENDLEGIERAISGISREISILHEYRTRLIADVVTGKLDVREAAANLPEETDETEVLEDEFAGDEETAEEELESEPEEE